MATNKYQNGNQRYYPQNDYNLDWITAANAFNNPWTAIGALIGTSLAKNYVNRGEEKLEKSLADSIPTGEAPTDAQVAQQMVQNAQAQAPTQAEQAQQNIFDKYKQANPIELQPNRLADIGLEAIRNKSSDPLEIAALQTAINKAQGTEQPSQVTADENIAFQNYLANNAPHMDASGNLTNMDAAANLQAQKQQATAQVAENNMRPFSVKDWEAQVWAEGRKQGRPDYQIQAVIDRMKPQAEVAEQKYNDYKESNILQTLYANLDNPQVALAAIADLQEINPNKAAILSKGITTPREYQTQQNKMAQIDASNAYKSSGNNSSGTGKLPTSVQEYYGLENIIRTKIANGEMTPEEGKRLLSGKVESIAGLNGKAKGTTAKQDANVDAFADEIAGQINQLDSNLKNYDADAAGETLDAIASMIKEKPELWNKLDDDLKREVQEWQYYGNHAREGFKGYKDNADVYGSALTDDAWNRHADWKRKWEDLEKEYNNAHAKK